MILSISLLEISNSSWDILHWLTSIWRNSLTILKKSLQSNMPIGMESKEWEQTLIIFLRLRHTIKNRLPSKVLSCHKQLQFLYEKNWLLSFHLCYKLLDLSYFYYQSILYLFIIVSPDELAIATKALRKYGFLESYSWRWFERTGNAEPTNEEQSLKI